MNIYEAILSALKYTLGVIPLIISGIILATFFEKIGFIQKLTWISKPVIRYGHLSKISGLSFITAFASPTTANAILFNHYQKRNINTKELFISVLSHSFPSILLNSRYILPIILPLLGNVGFFYFMIILFVGLMKTVCVLTIGKFILSKKKRPSTFEPTKKVNQESIVNLLKKSVITSLPLIKKVIILTTPITFLTFVLIEFKLFNILEVYLKDRVTIIPIPSEGLSIVAARFAHGFAAYTVAGNLLSEGIMNSKEIIISLLTANILASLITALRVSSPSFIGIFGFNLGLKLMMLSILIKIPFMIGIILMLFYFW